jgi:anthranilate/para-aminobenzoate synthase component I
MIMSEYYKSLYILHALAHKLNKKEPEIDIFVQGTLSNLIVAIGGKEKLTIRLPKQANWGKIKNFILSNTNLGKYVVGYLGHGLHRTSYNPLIRNSHHPDAYLVVPDTVIRINDGIISEIIGDLSKYCNFDFTKVPVDGNTKSDYFQYDSDLSVTEYKQKIALIQDWIEERNQDDRITLSRQLFLDADFSILDQVVFSAEEKFSNPKNRIIYQKFFDEYGNLIEFGGISPELLVDGLGLVIKTNKLSGTHKRTSSLSEQELWLDKKIIDEHRESIASLVKKLRVITNEIKVEGPMIFELPTLLHLLSIISTRAQNKHQLMNIIQALVLTGATAGDEGYNKLCEVEGISRGAYYGLSVLFGPEMIFFSCPQILRCVFRFNDVVWTQVGGCISRLSYPEDEFYETVYKAESILKNFKKKDL